MAGNRKPLDWLSAGIVLVGVLPMLIYWFFFGRVPHVSVAEAEALLRQTNATVALVDVRPPAVFSSNHVAGAVNWPYETILAITDATEMPALVQGRKLLLICDSGLSSALAVRKLKAVASVEAYNVSDGMEAWETREEGRGSPPPFRPLSNAEQWLAVFTAFGIKPVYMLVSLALIMVLWRQQARDLVALRWGLIWFWLGENACTINWAFYGERSHVWEYLHGYGMIVGFSFVTYAVLEGMDLRVIKYSPEHERCAALSLCRACSKYAAVPCGLRRLFTLLIPAAMAVACLPLCQSLKVVYYNTHLFGTVHHYWHSVVDQLYEGRFCVALALVLLAASWFVLMFQRPDPVPLAKRLFAAAIGPLSFGCWRMFFFAAYSDNLMWFVVWEELTELIFVLSVAFVLWVFRDGLFGQASPAPPSERRLEQAST